MSIASTPSKLTWSGEHLKRFWDYCAGSEGARSEYFARRYAPGIVSFLGEVRPISGSAILDYGCGPGFLVPELLQRGAAVTAVDYSPDSVDSANQRFDGNSGWMGARLARDESLPLETDSFDIVCCVETIEHLLEQHLDVLFTEIRRVLKPGGIALLTTPNQEDLGANMVFCPSCQMEFHRWQHVRSWDSNTLSAALSKHGLQVPFCRPISFSWFQEPQSPRSWKDWNARDAAAAIRRQKDKFLDAMMPRQFPNQRSFIRTVGRPGGFHLVAIAERPQGSI